MFVSKKHFEFREAEFSLIRKQQERKLCHRNVFSHEDQGPISQRAKIDLNYKSIVVAK